MASSGVGADRRYHCEFLAEVGDEYKCKVCGRVAIGLVLLGCCGEHACEACVSPFHEDGRPCPCCGESNISWLPHVKHRKFILALEVRCSMKDRGCEWTGVLQDLDAHLDFDTGDCQFVDVQCPNKCSQPVPKCGVPDHLENSCPKRDYNCRYCGFTGTYDEVCNEHYPQCDSYPIPCPNSCTVVSIERGTLDMHLNMCPYQEVECDFAYAGCKEKVQRELLDKHMADHVQHHLSLLSAVTLQLNKRLVEKDQQIEALKQENTQLAAKQCSSETQSDALSCEVKQLVDRTAACETATFSHTFLLPNVEEEREKNTEWFSPPMYTHPGGYKFCINVNLDGNDTGKGSHVSVFFCQLKGEFDEKLKWPAKVHFTLTLHNNTCKGKWYNVSETFAMELRRQSVAMSVYCISKTFVRHHAMNSYYTCFDCLFFSVDNIYIY